jgi:hypothetical protein
MLVASAIGNWAANCSPIKGTLLTTGTSVLQNWAQPTALPSPGAHALAFVTPRSPGVTPSSPKLQAFAMPTTSANSHAPSAKPVTALACRAFSLDTIMRSLHDTYSNPDIGARTLIHVKRPAAEQAAQPPLPPASR